MAAARPAARPGIGGSTWQWELAALRLVNEWAEKEQGIARSPVLVHQVRLRGGTVMTADQTAQDVRSADVKWVTPRTCRLWRDTGAVTTVPPASRRGSRRCCPQVPRHGRWPSARCDLTVTLGVQCITRRECVRPCGVVTVGGVLRRQDR